MKAQASPSTLKYDRCAYEKPKDTPRLIFITQTGIMAILLPPCHLSSNPLQWGNAVGEARAAQLMESQWRESRETDKKIR